MKYLLLISLIFLGTSSSAKIIEQIAVIVNDDIITTSDLETYKDRLKSGALVDETLLQLSDAELLKKDPKALREHIINEKIIDSQVEKQGFEVTIERVEQEIRSVTQRNGMTRNQLRDALAQQGVKFSDYQAFIKTSLGRQALIDKEVASKIKISDEDISSYYLKEKGIQSSQVFEFNLAHILFLPQNGGEEAAKERASQVLRRLKNSTMSFEKLAAQYSEDPNFAQGGLLGSFKAGEMLKEIEQAVRGLPAGEISGVVRTRVGFHILKVLKRTLVENPEIEKEKNRIRNILYIDAFKKQLQLWLDRQRDEAFIRINVDKA